MCAWSARCARARASTGCSRPRCGAEKWRLIESCGPLEKLGALWVQRIGLTAIEAAELLAATTSHGNIPEPLRLAHIIAGGVELGASRGRP